MANVKTETRLETLARQCEQATGPDRELDAEIAVAALGFFVAEPRYPGAPTAYGYVDKDGSRVEPGQGGMQLIRPFTASVDAALTLVPEGITEGGTWWPNPKCELRVQNGTISGETVSGEAATLALAITAAALRAHAAKR